MTQRTGRLALLALALTAACGSAPTPTLAAASGPTTPPVPPKVAVKVVPVRHPATPSPVPSFRTPEAAMRYLADAWNRGDLRSLKHVTDPSARDLLDDMHREAMNLRLSSCTRREEGDYECVFIHDYPIGYRGDRSAGGKAWMVVGPATRSGWYMTVYEGCG